MRRLVRLIEGVVIALMGVIATLVVAEVVLRGLFGLSLVVYDELTRYLMIWTVMLAAALLIREDGHIRIGLLAGALKPRAALFLHCLSQVLVIVFLAGLLWSSLVALPGIVGQTTITLGVSMAWFYAALPVGAALMILLTLHDIATRLRAGR